MTHFLANLAMCLLVSTLENYPYTSDNVAGNVTSANCEQTGLSKVLFSQMDCLKANKIIFIMIKTLMTMEDQSERYIYTNSDSQQLRLYLNNR